MELLSPAGNFSKLKYALEYGADAVYASGKLFGLRAKSTNFTKQELAEAVRFCHKNQKKIFVTVNIFAHNRDIDKLPSYLKFLEKIGVDALIISDPGVFALAKEFAPKTDIHISTQANVTSWKTAEFWYKLGTKRIILARELTFPEILDIKRKVPQIELEMFVHGAMCMSYSGRCLLSSFLTGRSANQGLCTQPCRWNYALTEEKRPGEYFPIEEDRYGTYILNSKDLCLFDRLAEIYAAGIESIKIEGRMKSIYYVANVTRTYKKALELVSQNSTPPVSLHEELLKVSHRQYTQAFFDKFDSSDTQYFGSSSYIRDYQFCGEIVKSNKDYIFVFVRGKFQTHDELEIIFPDSENDFTFKVGKIFDGDDRPLEFSKPNTTVKLEKPRQIDYESGIIRRKKI